MCIIITVITVAIGLGILFSFFLWMNLYSVPYFNGSSLFSNCSCWLHSAKTKITLELLVSWKNMKIITLAGSSGPLTTSFQSRALYAYVQISFLRLAIAS